MLRPNGIRLDGTIDKRIAVREKLKAEKLERDRIKHEESEKAIAQGLKRRKLGKPQTPYKTGKKVWYKWYHKEKPGERYPSTGKYYNSMSKPLQVWVQGELVEIKECQTFKWYWECPVCYALRRRSIHVKRPVTRGVLHPSKLNWCDDCGTDQLPILFISYTSLLLNEKWYDEHLEMSTLHKQFITQAREALIERDKELGDTYTLRELFDVARPMEPEYTEPDNWFVQVFYQGKRFVGETRHDFIGRYTWPVLEKNDTLPCIF